MENWDSYRRMFLHQDGNIYQRIYENEGWDDDYWQVVVLKKVGSDRKVLRLPPPGYPEYSFYVNGVDLDEVNENVREIVLENRSDLLGTNNTLPYNFIRDKTKLPNLREIRAITRDHRGKCLTNVWITGWDEREVSYLIHYKNMSYRVLDEKRGIVSTVPGYDKEGAYHIDGDLILPEKIPYRGKEYTLEKIAYYSFRENNIRSVSIPPSVKIIETGAFRFCDNLERVRFSEGLEKIEEYAFSGCLNLKEIVFPDSLVYIYDQFIHPLKHVRIPASLRFAYLESETITIQSKYDPAVFEFCSFITKEIIVEADCDTLRTVDGVLYDKDMKKLLFYPPLKEDMVFTVPASVKSISENAFSRYMRHLRELRIPSSVRKIPESLRNHMYIQVTRIRKSGKTKG